MRFVSSLVGVVALVLLPLVRSQINTATGTLDGYDVGGNAPICFLSYIEKDPNATGDADDISSNYTAIEILNDGLFAAAKEGDLTTMTSVCAS
jgi:hypothetical protein